MSDRGPVADTHRRRYAGRTLRTAIPRDTTAALAERRGVTQRTIQRDCDGENRSWLTGFLDELERVYEAGGDLFPIVAHVTSYAKYLKLHGRPAHALVERWHELAEAEHEYEMRQNRARQNGESAEGEVLADQAHAAVLTELSAVRRILEERHIDPRGYRREM
ncbi:MAG: hypothetical protein GWN53_17410 [Gammaproteobacteria bacterium]|uniref:Uncharacterized protein n=1 Tax=Candidatus Kutchimonas denitrificans TaxID=3056748 RepID=A0AAE4ZC69_9BACT|nr:hypothetical protein [Candidatus Kutchimonas denitrificans]NIV53620.1 hypothetical protein [Gammaproteobacteria bacterium]